MRTIRYTIDDLEEIAHRATRALSEFSGREINLDEWPPVNDCHKSWDLRDWEIDWFVHAYRKKLFDLKCRWGTPDEKWRDGRPRVDFADGIMALGAKGESLGHEFLVVWPFTRLFSHEYLTQFSIAGELVATYKQPPERLEAESGGYAIDLAVYDNPRPPHGTGKPVIGAEVKVNDRKHDALVKGIKKCRGMGLTADSCPLGRGDYRKCLWIRENNTVRYLWVRSAIGKTSPLLGKSELFEVIRTADGPFDLSDPLDDSERDAILSRKTW